jgi:RNA polymerase sigma-70 factor, ECF subfamily
MNNNDYDIVQRILAGEQKAYSELVDRHKDKAMSLAVRMLKNHHEAEEVLQDAFVRAFRALPSFEWKSNFSTWFYRIVFNLCSTLLSKRGDQRVISIHDDEEENSAVQIASPDEVPDIELEQKELKQIVQQEIDRMPIEYSAILTLFVVQDMSYDEIVSTTGLPLGTVKNRLFRARTLLRNAVLKHYSGSVIAV